jgi:hypothetical protein
MNWIYICYVEESRPPLWSSGQSSWLHNGDVLCFLWGTNWMYICYAKETRPPLWSSSQSSWLQIQRFGFDSRRYHIFWEVVGLKRGPLSFVSTTEEMLERKSNGSGLVNRDYCRRYPSRWPRTILYQQTLALTSPTSGGRSVGIVLSQTQATEFIWRIQHLTWIVPYFACPTSREIYFYAIDSISDFNFGIQFVSYIDIQQWTLQASQHYTY